MSKSWIGGRKEEEWEWIVEKELGDWKI